MTELADICAIGAYQALIDAAWISSVLCGGSAIIGYIAGKFL